MAAESGTGACALAIAGPATTIATATATNETQRFIRIPQLMMEMFPSIFDSNIYIANQSCQEIYPRRGLLRKQVIRGSVDQPLQAFADADCGLGTDLAFGVR